MDLLEPVVQPYAWGSREAIARLQGRPAPTEEPEAELWMGAHPAAPSGVAGRGTLADVVAADPERELGADVAAAFEGRLPFLLKVLAADKALSIQVHPDRENARAGFAAEEAAGVPADRRNYRDDWPKPEILCALTDFEALAGLREPGEAAQLFRGLGVPALAPVADRLERGDDDGLLDALRTLLAWPADERGDLLSQAVEAAAALSSADERLDHPDRADAYAALVLCADDHPGDLGALCSLLLHHVVLAPGEALFMAAGGLHAYLRGTGVEILANSDNVLRAGLTGKHIDVDELCRIVDPAVGVPVLRPGPDAAGVTAYDPGVPVPEFALHRVDLGDEAVALPGSGARIVLVTDGRAVLAREGQRLEVGAGGSAYVSAADGPVRCSGRGTAFVASAGR